MAPTARTLRAQGPHAGNRRRGDRSGTKPGYRPVQRGGYPLSSLLWSSPRPVRVSHSEPVRLSGIEVLSRKSRTDSSRHSRTSSARMARWLPGKDSMKPEMSLRRRAPPPLRYLGARLELHKELCQKPLTPLRRQTGRIRVTVSCAATVQQPE
jgi:hypothetical protein